MRVPFVRILGDWVFPQVVLCAIFSSRVSPCSLAGQPAGSQEGHTFAVVLQTSGNRIRTPSGFGLAVLYGLV